VSQAMSANHQIRVLAFDVFGTCVDWHGSIAREVNDLGLKGREGVVDGAAFATALRAGYKPAMARVRSGELGWTKIDDLHRMILDGVLADFGVAMDEAARVHLNKAWHRLTPWPDTVSGLARLKSRFIITTLSNGNLGLLTNMAKTAGLPWDCILSAEVFRHYKPDPETYLGVCEVFDIKPSQMLMVACHKDDLRSAASHGCQTAFVERPMEFGAGVSVDVSVEPAFQFHAVDFNDLADQLGC
jgi:2-haloacid dehalogenase